MISITDAVEGWATDPPDTPAIRYGERQIGYPELMRYVDGYIRVLHERTAPGRAVLVLIAPGPELVFATLACFKAGVKFVPVHPRWSTERLEQVRSRTDANIALCDREFQTLLQGSGLAPVIADELEPPLPGSEPLVASPIETGYIYFTSGSTGRPKAVVGSHAGLCKFIDWQRASFWGAPGERTSLLTAATFDPFLRDVFLPLTSGGTLCIPDDSNTILDPEVLAGWLRREQIVLTHMVPTLFRGLLRDGGPALANLDTLRLALLAGEPLRGDDVRLSAERLPKLQLVNLYGPTETTLATCSHRVVAADVDVAAVPIGRPIPGSQILVVDERGEPCPDHVTGELVIVTDHGSHGYLEDPELTAQSFDWSDPEGRLRYRTGDLGWRRPDGLLVCAGRRDHQLKVHGMKVDLAAVEAMLCRQPGVREAAVAAAVGSSGPILCAFVAGEIDEVTSLRGQLLAQLPAHSVPSQWQLLAALPRLSNGKVDRHRLSQQATEMLTRVAQPPALIQPATDDPEAILTQLWREVLGLSEIGPEDDFIAAGGHSLLAARLARRIRETFNVEMRPIEVLTHPTIRTELEWLATAARRPLSDRAVSSETDAIVATQRQLDIYLASRLATEPSTYNMPWAVRISGPLAVDSLSDALRQLAKHHPSLRTTFHLEGERLLRRLQPVDSVLVEVLDQRGHDAAVGQLAESLVRPFDLAAEAPFRAAIVQLAENEHLLFWDLHHIAADGVSEQVLRQTLNAILANEQPAPEELRMLDLHPAKPATPEGFDDILSSLPHLDLTEEQIPEARQSSRGALHSFFWSGDLAGSVRDSGTTVTGFEYLVTAYAMALGAHAGCDDLVIGIAEAGRVDERAESTVGLLMNIVPVRLRFPADISIEQALCQASERTRHSIARGPVPAELLASGTLPRNPGLHPIFDALLVFQNHPQTALLVPDCSTEEVRVHTGTAKYDLTLYAHLVPNGIAFELEYCRDLFDVHFTERFAQTVCWLLDQLSQDTGRRLAAVELAPAQIMPGATRAPLEPLGSEAVHQVFGRLAAADPERIAICHADRQVSYGELNARANAIAAAILARPDHQVDSLIGVLVGRSPDLIATILGVLKAGCSYLPLDPDHPAGRLRAIVEHSGCRLLISDQIADLGVDIVSLDAIPAQDSTDPKLPVDLSDTIYVIYTSGSTGTPKGVQLSHGNITNFVAGISTALDLQETTRICCLTTVSFDIFVLETLVPLATGASLVLADATEQLDLAKLGELLRRHKADVLQVTPSRLAIFLDHPQAEQHLSGIASFVIGGEPIRPEAVARLLDFDSRPRIYNVYGPTETSVWSTTKRIADVADLSVGREIRNTRLHVMDTAGRPRPVGSIGELWIGGSGVCKGYLHAPELTERAFQPDPQHPTERVFRSGDLVRWNESGELECLGRIDHQVKVRGYRIELGEIENCLSRVPGVARCVCATRTDPATQATQIIAFHTATESVSTDVLQEAVREQLPEYFMPQHFVAVPEFPLTGSGKADRRALLAMMPTAPEVVSEPLGVDQGPVELVRRAWQQALGHDRFRSDQGFFEVGGTSLSLVLLHNIIERVSPGAVSLVALFSSPTVQAMADLLSDIPDDPALVAPVVLSRPVLGRGTGSRALELPVDVDAGELELAALAFGVTPTELLIAGFEYLLARLSKKPAYIWYLAVPGGHCRVEHDSGELADLSDLVGGSALAVRAPSRARAFTHPKRSADELAACVQTVGTESESGFDLELLLDPGPGLGSPRLRFNGVRVSGTLARRITELYDSAINELITHGLENASEKDRRTLRRAGFAVRQYGPPAV